jgi:ACS family hexuronate transporter-like MFS transporter
MTVASGPMTTERPLSPLAAWVLTLAATSTMAVSYVDRQALAVLAPTIQKQLDISDTAYGWLGAAFSLAYLVFAPIAGRWIDGVGARRGLLVAVLAWSLVAALHALVPGLWTLLGLRILLGMAEAPSFPAAAQTVSRALPPTSRDAGYGILFTGSSIGGACAAVLLPWLEHRYEWRLALLFTAVVGLAWVPMWIAVTWGARARAVLAIRAEAAADPFAWDAMLRDPAVQRAVIGVLASAPINGFVLQWGSKVLVSQHAVLQQDVGKYLWLPPLLFDAGAIGFGALAAGRVRWFPGDAPNRALFAVAAALMLLIGGLGFGTTPWQTTVAAGLAIAGGGGVYVLLTADMLSRVAPSRIAAAGSLTASAQSLALIVALPIVGMVHDHAHSYVPVGLGLMAWALPGAVIWLAWDPRPRA